MSAMIRLTRLTVTLADNSPQAPMMTTETTGIEIAGLMRPTSMYGSFKADGIEVIDN
jgi:hypothetical protein